MEQKGQASGTTLRLRIRLADGTEWEAEGSPDAATRERDFFLARFSPIKPDGGTIQNQAASGQIEPVPNIAWESIIERLGKHIQLRGKLSGYDRPEQEASLVLLAASEKLLGDPKPRATLLARWLRASGYPTPRIDRTLQEALSQGQIIASGTRRGRRYELTDPGKIRAYLLAHKLSRTITGRP
ncbi:MAG: hypothetical protein ACYCPQ_08945 [Elusimicrobiota bacterium]